MFFRVSWLVIAAAVLTVFSGVAVSQTEEQKEAYRRYLEYKGSRNGEETAETPADMYEDKTPLLPPASGAEKNGRSSASGPERFGLEIFAHAPADFVVSTETPVPPDYTLGPGDNLIVNLWGGVDQSFHLLIDREGKVFIPKAGDLVLWGLTAAQAEKRIRDHLGRIYSDFSMNLILGKIRSITVYVSGEVTRPGAYTVSSLYTLFNTLYLAGGPTERGSLRCIRLVRGNSVIREVDIYRLLIEGQNDDIKLESNDIVFVPVTGPLVTVTGEVRRPGIYEVTGKERLLDVVSLAGGARSSAFLGKVELSRFENNTRVVVFDLNMSDTTFSTSDNIPLLDGDRINLRSIPSMRENVVYLAGEVKYPGEYEYFPGMRITDLVDAEDLLPHSYIDRVFIRRTLDDDVTIAIQVDLRKVLLSAPGETAEGAADKVSGDIQERVIVENIVLRPRDILEVYPLDRMRDREYVSIEGQVRLPGTYDYTGMMTVSDLIYLSGGVKKKAYLLNAELARLVCDGTRVSRIVPFNLEKILGGAHGEADLLLEPGDVVFIRDIPRFKDHARVTVEGEVVFPGIYVLESDNETLGDVIARAGGVTRDAFLEGALFERNSIEKELRQRHVFDVIEALQDQAVDSSGVPVRQSERLDIEPSQMNRIIIDLPALLRGPGDGEDIILKPGDRIVIPGIPSGINVLGAVASSGTIKYMHGKKAKFYIDRAGGFTKWASRGEVRILKADGQVIRKGASSHSIEIGDAILVPEKILKERDWLKVFQSTISILAGAMTTIYIVTKI